MEDGARGDRHPARVHASRGAPTTSRVGQPPLDVVVVSYRSRELTRTCLESIRKYVGLDNVRLFVVDNASRDGTVEMIRGEYPHITLICNEENVGFARANNLALRRGTSPIVLLINPDARLTAGTLDVLLELMASRPAIGMCGCRLELADGTFDHASKRSFPTVVGALAHFTGVGRGRDAPHALSQYRAPDIDSGPVEAINGAFMLIRRQALDEVGLFDEGYWMYMEDLDLCYRFAQRGWLIWYEPRVHAVHLKGGTTGRVRSIRLNYAFHYGMFRFYRKHYAAGRNPVLNAAVYGGIGVKLLISIVRSGVRRAGWTRPSTSRT